MENAAADVPPDGPPLDAIRQLLDDVNGPPPTAADRLRAAAPLEPAIIAQPETAKTSRRQTVLAALRGRIAGFQPSWRLSSLILLAAVMIARPWLIPLLLLALVVLAAIIWFTLGPDRATEVIAAGFARYERRFPRPAARLRRGLQKSARRVEALAARLPDRWTRGLYVPDFSAPGAARDKLGEDPFGKLASGD